MDTHSLYYIWLSTVLYAGSPSAKILLEHFDNIKDVYDADFQDYLNLGIGKGDAKRLSEKSLDMAGRYLAYCEKEHIGLLCYDNPYYPDRLKSITDPPALFYYRGKVEKLDDFPCIAMVGTRACSEKGFRTAYRTAYKAASFGAVIVNGLALGSDGACMTGALDADGYAVGLLGCGIDRIYPADNKELFYRLSHQGLILSEFPPFSKPEGRNFPIRNRVISGLSVASVIFEADEGSGALITASHALAQGRRLFAVPGNVNDPLYAGPLNLIKDGATVFTDAEDILTEYSLMFPHRINIHAEVFIPPTEEDKAVEKAFSAATLKKNAKEQKSKRVLVKHPPKVKPKKQDGSQNEVKPLAPSTAQPQKEPPNDDVLPTITADTSMLSPMENTIYALFCKSEEMSADQIAAKGIKIDDVLSSLTLLEVYGLVESLPGGRYRKL